MGNYHCLKCNIPKSYYKTNDHATRYSCRVHRYNDDAICSDCNSRLVGNCKHIFVRQGCC